MARRSGVAGAAAQQRAQVVAAVANRHRNSLPSVDSRARLQSRQKACVTLLITPISPPPSA
jgi:hypothetical protein